jgi:isopentenyl-diphosphate delta-isomerase type 1
MTTIDQVELLDDAGRRIGVADRASVHSADTPLHRAFSVHLVDRNGRVLLTRRALSKRTWPGVWTNSCCGHPRPGESDADAIRRRVKEELGVDVRNITPIIPDFHYMAADASGIVEHEICPVYRGEIDAVHLNPDPDEVAEVWWVDPELAMVGASLLPGVLSPWCAEQFRLMPASALLTGDGPPETAGYSCDQMLADVDDRLMGCMLALEELWARLEGKSESERMPLLPGSFPSWLTRAGLNGGKKLRPRFAYWGFVASAAKSYPNRGRADLVTAGAGLQLLHAFAIIHDDVMDDSTRRRGSLAAHAEAAQSHRRAKALGSHAAFGRNTAILLGDVALAEAERLATELPPDLRAVWSLMVTELMLGQSIDLTAAAARNRDPRDARKVSRLKSGCYTVLRPLELGATAAGATPGALASLRRYGDKIGEAFQLRDDILGVWGDPALTGKPAGDDLRLGKATAVLAHAEVHLRGKSRLLLERLRSGELSDSDVVALSEVMERTGIRKMIEALIAAAVEDACAALDSSALAADGVDGLKALAHQVAWREQ